MGHTFGVIILTVFAFASFSFGTKRFRFHPETITTWSDNENINFTYALDETVPYANFSFKALKKFTDVFAHFEGVIKTTDSKQYAVINSTYSLCQILTLRNSHPVAMLAFAHLKSHGNIPETCPIQKGIYYVSKIWIPEESIPTNMPEIEVDGVLQLWIVDNGNLRLVVNNSMVGHAAVKEVSSTGLLDLMKG